MQNINFLDFLSAYFLLGYDQIIGGKIVKKLNGNNRVILVFVVTLLFAITSCAPMHVKRIDAKKITDLSGQWNDTDVRLVCDSLVKDASSAARIAMYSNEHGRVPVVIVGSFENASDEHIDTSIIVKKMETALLRSRKMDFVAASEQRAELRAEIKNQQEWTTAKTRKKLREETGADLMMLGTVKTMVDQYGRQMTRNYYVYAELIELQSGKKLWMGENAEIKKLITRPAAKP